MPDADSKCVHPSWTLLNEVFESPKKVFIASPWISTEGADFLERLRDSHPALRWELWTRLDVLDWVAGYSDYPALLRVLQGVSTSRLSLRATPSLHMKVFWDGRDRALVGSCNLTGGGFATNLEAAVLFRGGVGDLPVVLDDCRPRIPEVTVTELRAFVRDLGSVSTIKSKWESLRADVDGFAQTRSETRRREPPYLGLR